MDKSKSTAIKSSNVMTVAKTARIASSKLARITAPKRNETLKLIAARLEKNKDEILAANELDLSLARKLVEQGKMSEALVSRLKLDVAKLADLVSGINHIAAAEDPLGKTTLARELDSGLQLFRVTCPIGLIGVIFEARPDALPQIASLCIKSGNAAILKGGREAHHSNHKLFELIDQCVTDCGLPAQTVTLLESREEMDELLQGNQLIDLIIARGSNELVKEIQNKTRVPLLGHAEGLCHIYIDKKSDLEKAIKITADAKVSYPAACNAVETLLIHKDVADKFLAPIIDELIKHKVVVKADKKSLEIIGRKDIMAATEDDWSKEYGDLILSIKVVDSIDEAIEHINSYGSGHTESMITEDAAAFEHFFASVNSANIFMNASTRFADGFRYGFGAEVGISTGKLHPRGPVGLEGLVTYKYKIVGHGHVVQDYVGDGAKKFTHRTIAET